MANLNAQTSPVERIYVFDNNDTSPVDLAGSVIVAREKLTIYEAWNLAIARVTTPYVMNLNLDDRLAPDAVATLEKEMLQGADLVGGDWKICFSQAETDTVPPCQPASTMPCLPDWPPIAGSLTRLGSGTGQRGTMGPACMWNMSLHQEFPRFPWRFMDGTLIRTIGDQIWWLMLADRDKTIIRCPMIIGNYHSHPSSQAEFRHSASVEMEKLLSTNVSLI
jgi:hypothetical protein